MEKKVYDFIKGNLINLCVVLISCAYVLYAMVQVERTQLTVWECIVQATLGIVVGLLIKQGLGENGFSKGYNSDIWKSNLAKYSETCNLANPYIDLIDNFYDAEEKEKKYQYRRSNLINVRLKYDDFFDANGEYIGSLDGLTRGQKRIVKKCVKVKIYNLNLLSEYDNEIENDTKREKTDKSQRAKMFGKNLWMQVACAIIGVYFIFTWNGWSWGAFIMGVIQVLCWIGCGITEMYQNYNYVAVDKVNKLTKKKELILKFTKGCEKGLYGNEIKKNSNVDSVSVI